MNRLCKLNGQFGYIQLMQSLLCGLSPVYRVSYHCLPLHHSHAHVRYFLYSRTRLGYILHLLQLRQKPSSKHSVTQPIVLPGVTIIPLPILTDNYAYLVVDTVSNVAIVVDPSDPEEVQNAVREKNLNLKAILTTHKHWDHAGGNEALKKAYPGLRVYGGAKDCVAGETQ